jgi:hypothetical protein
MHFCLPVHARGPIRLIFLGLVIVIMLRVKYKLGGCKLVNVFHTYVTSSLVRPNNLLSTLFPYTLILSLDIVYIYICSTVFSATYQIIRRITT